MSEKQPDFNEIHDVASSSNAERPQPAVNEQEHAASEAKKAPESIDHILQKIEKEARTSQEITRAHHQEEPKEESFLNVGLQLKNQSLSQTLKKTRQKLPTHLRAFSKVIHNPDVDIVSEVASQTIARPSGLLVGGFFSALGSLAALLVCRYFGYEYNYAIGLTCFVGGFFLGLLFELLHRAVRKSPA